MSPGRFAHNIKRVGWLLCLGWVIVAPANAQNTYQGCTEITQVPEDECKALERLYENAGGIAWFNQTGWLRANQPCSWFGVTCNSQQWPLNVIKIELIDNNVGGSLPGELGNLPALEELIIENTSPRDGIMQLAGTLPATMSSLKNLRVVKLGKNKIRGEIPPSYGRLKYLQELDLHDNQFDGFLQDSLGSIETIKSIDLSNNQFKGFIPDSWGQIDSLETLDLSHNLLNGRLPASLGDLSKLKSLKLKGNNLSGSIPKSYGKLSNLLWLILSDNNFEGALLPEISMLRKQLAFCELENNSARLCVPDRSLFRPNGETEVCGVAVSESCSYCTPNDANNSACKGLESLYYETQGYAWSNNEGWLESNNLCDWFGIGCSEDAVREIQLAGNNLSGPIPESLGSLTPLTSFDLSNNALTGPLPFQVAQLAANSSSCSLANNASNLCIPDTPEYQALGQNPLCQLPLSATCSLPSQNSFQGTLHGQILGDGISLVWTVRSASEETVFNVEKKSGDSFSSIAMVPGIASVQTEQSFIFPIMGLKAGVHIYRIKQTDPDGSIAYSSEIELLIGIEEGILIGDIYPNPTLSTSYLDLYLTSEERITITLYNVLGQRIKSLYDDVFPANQSLTISIDLQGLVNGSYFIHVKGSTFSSTRSMMVRR